MLGLKLTGQLGRRAGLGLIPLMTLVLVACGSVNEQGPNGSGGPGSSGSAGSAPTGGWQLAVSSVSLGLTTDG